MQTDSQDHNTSVLVFVWNSTHHHDCPAHAVIETPIVELQILEWICMVYFTAEYIIRFLVVTRKCAFVKNKLNLIDLIAVSPFWIEQIIGDLIENDTKLSQITTVFRVLRVLRVMRVLKLARYSTGLQKFALVMKKSAASLFSALAVATITMVLCSTIVYFLEEIFEDEEAYSARLINNMFDSMWWGVVTMSSVGYGDMYPVTPGW